MELRLVPLAVTTTSTSSAGPATKVRVLSRVNVGDVTVPVVTG
jgi:hypothetical protein